MRLDEGMGGLQGEEAFDMTINNGRDKDKKANSMPSRNYLNGTKVHF